MRSTRTLACNNNNNMLPGGFVHEQRERTPAGPCLVPASVSASSSAQRASTRASRRRRFSPSPLLLPSTPLHPPTHSLFPSAIPTLRTPPQLPCTPLTASLLTVARGRCCLVPSARRISVRVAATLPKRRALLTPTPSTLPRPGSRCLLPSLDLYP